MRNVHEGYKITFTHIADVLTLKWMTPTMPVHKLTRVRVEEPRTLLYQQANIADL
jgi:hypothetical protein